MPTSPYFPTYYAGHSGEQGLVQDLVDEQIKLFGTDIYYIPKIVLADSTLDEVRYTKYQEQFQVEMLLQNVMGFGDNAEFISKFGLRITDEIKSSLLNYEPRIDNIEVTVQVSPDRNEMNCTVQYDIVGLPAPTQEVDVLLFPARV